MEWIDPYRDMPELVCSDDEDECVANVHVNSDEDEVEDEDEGRQVEVEDETQRVAETHNEPERVAETRDEPERVAETRDDTESYFGAIKAYRQGHASERAASNAMRLLRCFAKDPSNTRDAAWNLKCIEAVMEAAQKALVGRHYDVVEVAVQAVDGVLSSSNDASHLPADTVVFLWHIIQSAPSRNARAASVLCKTLQSQFRPVLASVGAQRLVEVVMGCVRACVESGSPRIRHQAVLLFEVSASYDAVTLTRLALLEQGGLDAAFVLLARCASVGQAGDGVNAAALVAVIARLLRLVDDGALRTALTKHAVGANHFVRLGSEPTHMLQRVMVDYNLQKADLTIGLERCSRLMSDTGSHEERPDLGEGDEGDEGDEGKGHAAGDGSDLIADLFRTCNKMQSALTTCSAELEGARRKLGTVHRKHRAASDTLDECKTSLAREKKAYAYLFSKYSASSAALGRCRADLARSKQESKKDYDVLSAELTSLIQSHRREAAENLQSINRLATLLAEDERSRAQNMAAEKQLWAKELEAERQLWAKELEAEKQRHAKELEAWAEELGEEHTALIEETQRHEADQQLWAKTFEAEKQRHAKELEAEKQRRAEEPEAERQACSKVLSQEIARLERQLRLARTSSDERGMERDSYKKEADRLAKQLKAVAQLIAQSGTDQKLGAEQQLGMS